MPSAHTPLGERLHASPAALQLLEELRHRHGALLIHQSGGCCDGSAPMCLRQQDMLIGDSDILVGVIGTTPFYMARAQWTYWENCRLVLDVEPGRAGMFSLEGGSGTHFVTRPSLRENS